MERGMRLFYGPVGHAAFLALVLAVEAVLLLWPEALVVNGHEGDLLHTMDAARRLSLGEWPHQGFMTPLGVLAFAPISIFMQTGFGPGTSFRLGMILVALVLLPMIWLVSRSRLSPGLGLLFGAWTIIMVTGLVYGGDQATSSVSMYYNRWAWALVFLVGLTILVPPRHGERPQGDGALVGLALGLLAVMKMTAFVALFPAVLVWLTLGRDWRRAAAVAAAGGLVALAVTIAAGGPAYWLDYARNLLFIAQDSGRAKPGLDYTAVIANPTYLPGAIALFLSVIVLRIFRQKDAGLILLVLAPGLFYITYQNWGNDPTWLILLALVMLALRPAEDGASFFGIALRSWHSGLALTAIVLISASVANVSYSTLRSAALDRATMVPAFPDASDPDLLVARERAFTVSGKSPLPGVGEGGKETEPVLFAGETLPECVAQTGLMGMYFSFAEHMKDRNLARARIAVGDVVNPLWLWGAGARLPGLAPWYYGGTYGLEGTEYALMPLCPYKADSRKFLAKALGGESAPYTLVLRAPNFLLFKRN
jgi:hypothetical protein